MNIRARDYLTAKFSGAIFVLVVCLSCSAIAEESNGNLIGGAFNLVNHHNEPVTEKDFLGKFMLIYFGYTYCPDICPTDLQNISAALRTVSYTHLTLPTICSV